MSTRYFRRQRAIAWLLIAALPASLALTLAGCGGGGNSGDATAMPETRITPQAVAGTLNAAEVGGAGLTIVSALAAPAAVGAGGAFTTRVSDVGAQLLLAQDAGGQVRGLGFTIPGARGRAAAPTIDAESTALSLLFLTPGIMALDPDEAAQRVDEVKALAAFAPFAAYLKTALAETTVTALKDYAQCATLENACLDEWFALHPIGQPQALTRGNLARVTPIDSDKANAAAMTFEQVPSIYLAPYTGNQQVNITNNGWRFVEIYRRSEPRFNNPNHPPNSWTTVSNQTFGVLKGVNGLSVGSLLTGQATSGSSITDTLPNRDNFQSFDYYVVGPGCKGPKVDTPADFPGNGFNALGCTVVWTVLLPVLSFVSGWGDLFRKANPKQLETLVTSIWNLYKGAAPVHDIIGSVNNDLLSGTKLGIASGIINIALTFIGVIVSAIAAGTGATIVTLLGIVHVTVTGPAVVAVAAGIAAALAAIGTVMSSLNVLAGVGAFFTLPPVLHLTMKDYHIGLILETSPTADHAVAPTGKEPDYFTITATVRHFEDNQNPGTDIPAGDVVANAKVTFTTDLGAFIKQQTPTATLAGETGPSGTAQACLASAKGGVATVTVKVKETHPFGDAAVTEKTLKLTFGSTYTLDIDGAGGGWPSVDDDLNVYLNGKQIHTDHDNMPRYNAPVVFPAKKGDELVITVSDNGGSWGGGPFYLHDDHGHSTLVAAAYGQWGPTNNTVSTVMWTIKHTILW